MSENGLNGTWVDSRRHIQNRNRLPPEKLSPFAGLHVAFNIEGTEIVAHGTDHLAVEEMLRAKGIDPAEVVFSTNSHAE